MASFLERNTTLAVVIILILIGIIAYANSFSNEFVWDDKIIVEGNERIESFSNINKIFTEDLYYSSRKAMGYYRPIQTASYMADYFLWGKEAFGYRIFNLIIHIAAALVVYFFMLLLFNEKWKSLFIASIYTVHPAFIAIAGYVSGRADLLGLFFGLLSIYIAIKRIKTGKYKKLLPLSVIFYILAFLSKEYYLFIPVFIFLYLWIYRKDVDSDMSMKSFSFGIIFVASLYVVLRMTALNFHQEMGSLAETSFLTRLYLFPYILTNYVITVLIPTNLSMEKRLVYSSLGEARFIISFIVPAILGWMVYRYYKRCQKKQLYLLGWFILGVLPVSNLFLPLKVIWANHWVYMASIGLIGLVSLEADRLKKWINSEKAFKKIKFFSGIAIVVIFTLLSIRESSYWKTEKNLFNRIAAKSPYSGRNQFNLGKLEEEKGDLKKALEFYNQAIEKSSKNSEFYYTRAKLYRKIGDLPKAKEDFEMTVRLEPQIAQYQNDLGSINAELGNIDKAIYYWNKALEIDPNNELAAKNIEIIKSIRRP